MRKFLIGVAPAILIFGVFAWFYLVKTPVDFVPVWRVGQSWKVQVFSRRAGSDKSSFYHNIWRFKVIEKKAVGGRIVYVLRADEEEKKTGKGYRFELIYPTLALKSLSVYQDGKLTGTGRSASAAFFIEPEAAMPVPLDFLSLPVFTLVRADLRRPLVARSAWSSSGVTRLATLTQEIAADRPVRKLTITATGNLSSGDRIKSMQVWEEARPWWSGARRVRNGVKESEAILMQW